MDPGTILPLSLYGRNSASGTYGFFKKTVLKNGDYKNEVKEQPGSASVVQGVTEDRAGMGYSGIGYKTSGVRALPLASKKGSPFVEPTFENAGKGAYPLARFLYVYVNKAPGKPLSPIVKEFFKYVYSKEGQAVVIKDGYFPLIGESHSTPSGTFAVIPMTPWWPSSYKGGHQVGALLNSSRETVIVYATS